MLGKLKKQAESSIPSVPIWNSNIDRALKEWIVKKQKIISYTLNDEYSQEEFDQIFDTYNKVMVKAKHAGSGKSYALLKYVKGKDHAIACPQNAQSRKLQLEGFNAMTLYELCGMRPTDNGGTERAGNELSYDYVGLEEVGQYSTKEWCMIKWYMKNHPETKFIANGDELQNDPIEANFNPALSTDSYYKRIISSIFPHQVMLEIPKRYKANQVERVKQLRVDIFDNMLPMPEIIAKYSKSIESMDAIPADAGFVTYLQETRRHVNDWEHRRRGHPAMYVGMTLKANCHMGKGKNTRITKHSEYEVTAFDEKHIDLVDRSSGLQYDMKAMWRKNFSHPYANTGHSLQGATIDKPIVIFDTQFEHVDRKWIYVALTRSSDLDNVYVFNGKLEKQRLSIAAIDDKINNYIRQDMSGGRGYDTKNYIDIPWVIKQRKIQFHRCSCCHEVMNFTNNSGDLDWTVDRIENSLGHIKTNCSLMCLHCNITKK